MEKRPFLKSKPKRSPKPEPSPLPAAENLPAKTSPIFDSADDVNEIGRTGAGFDLELDRKNILQGIIFAEILGRPKGIGRYRK